MKILGGFLILLVSLSAHAEIHLRVRLATLPPSVTISGQGLQISEKSSFYKRVAIPQTQAIRLEVSEKNRWKLSQGDKVREISSEALVVQGQRVHAGSKALPERAILTVNRGKIDVIGFFELERYLLGVLPSEMPARWPIEALKAQAIAARTYALSKYNKRSSDAFHLEANVMDQVFEWRSVQRRPQDMEKVRRAVKETEGLVLKSQSGSVITSFYHADCGGGTDRASTVWGSKTSFPIAQDSGCRLRKPWTRKLSVKDVSQHLNQKFDKETSAVFVSLRSPSGRVKSLRVQFKDGSHQDILADDFRRIIGYNNLKSTKFSLHTKNGQLIFKGRGYGHGVGMCQHGARDLAKSGYDHRAILKKYYPAATLASNQ